MLNRDEKILYEYRQKIPKEYKQGKVELKLNFKGPAVGFFKLYLDGEEIEGSFRAEVIEMQKMPYYRFYVYDYVFDYPVDFEAYPDAIDDMLRKINSMVFNG